MTAREAPAGSSTCEPCAPLVKESQLGRNHNHTVHGCATRSQRGGMCICNLKAIMYVARGTRTGCRVAQQLSISQSRLVALQCCAHT